MLDSPPPAPPRPPGPTGAAAPLSRLLARAPLVGRVGDLAYLQEQYEAAAAGQGGRLVFIEGEPGAGKTRLAQEVGRTRRRGADCS